MPPRTPDVWTGIRNADRAGAVCPQNLMPVSAAVAAGAAHRFRHSSQASLPVAPSPFPNPKLMTEEILRNETELLKILTTPAASMRIKTLLQNQSEDCLFLDIYTPVSGEFIFHISHSSLPAMSALLPAAVTLIRANSCHCLCTNDARREREESPVNVNMTHTNSLHVLRLCQDRIELLFVYIDREGNNRDRETGRGVCIATESTPEYQTFSLSLSLES